MASKLKWHETAINAFIRVLGKERVKLAEAQRVQFARDEGHFRGILPEVVLEPTSVEQVSAVMRLCNEHLLPVIPFGTGTGLEGGSISKVPSVCLSLQQLEGGVTSLHEDDFDCSVRPSVTRTQLNEHVRDTGLFFPVDPGADASLCGMVATGASGTNAVRYGTMKENVLNLEVVLADGSVLHTRGKDKRPRKSAAGYNLTELFVGSEGTLGVITQATLRLHPRPFATSVAVAAFPNIHCAVTSVVETLQSAIRIARIELLNEAQIAACNAYSHTALPIKPTLFLEFHGANEDEVNMQSKSVGEICDNNSSISYEIASNHEDVGKLWKARHDSYYAAVALRKGATGFTTDVCVPISRLTEVTEETERDMQQHGITGTIVGHVGDGNFHVILPVFKENKEEMTHVLNFSNRLVKRALMAGGTCTGEHGIGLGKIRYLEEELGPVGISVMKHLKSSLDPNFILNPGKVITL